MKNRPGLVDSGRFSFSLPTVYQRMVTVAVVGFVVCTDEL